MGKTGTSLTTLQLLSAVGVTANVPYVGAVAACVIKLLETIQAAEQNYKDFRELTESVTATMDIVMKTVKAHEDSAPYFRHVCEDLEKYLEGVLKEMKDVNLKNSRGMKRFFRTKEVSVAITGFKQQVQKIKEVFMIQVTVDIRFAIADLVNRLAGLENKLAGLEDKINATIDTAIDAIGTSQRNFQKEMHALGTLQNERMDAILASILIQSQAHSSCKQLAGYLPSYKSWSWPQWSAHLKHSTVFIGQSSTSSESLSLLSVISPR
ncbi:hypothetical protein IW261DRAFT_1426846 [Armillaria novae-zelandiae]|uniref:Uncharacterized protein n=1 Tax=Armillaria novae-zelandiae TaxID=153914 RepID=A0AA39TY80_9AGAR|nr:hypothetical protein IW261DRAFT_1426846 [Armillaria novae-zelandiae]